MSPLAHAQQLILVLTSSWNSSSALLAACQREGAAWTPYRTGIPASLGKRGLSWGRGLHETPSASRLKREGDLRSPAGAFSLPLAFGYEHSQNVPWIKMAYKEILPSTLWVDDPNSPFYNKLVDVGDEQITLWKTAECMIRPGNPYQWGIVVDHNPTPAVPAAGSCIALHLTDSLQPTDGCTAIGADDLLSLLHWLDCDALPVIVQLPIAEYVSWSARWNCPNALALTDLSPLWRFE